MSERDFSWSRRDVLAGLAAATARLAASRGPAAEAASSRNIIDVHAHFQPPAIRAMNLPGPMNAWDLQKQMDDMDAAGVTRALLSITTPGVPSTGEIARRIARESNEYAAKLASDHGRRFGVFLALPLDDIDAALKEVAYGFDVLKAQGVGLFTSYSGRWLGDAQFDPLFAELDRRKQERPLGGVALLVIERVLAIAGDEVERGGHLAADRVFAGENPAELDLPLLRDIALDHRGEVIAGLRIAGEVDRPRIDVGKIPDQPGHLSAIKRRLAHRTFHRLGEA